MEAKNVLNETLNLGYSNEGKLSLVGDYEFNLKGYIASTQTSIGYGWADGSLDIFLSCIIKLDEKLEVGVQELPILVYGQEGEPDYFLSHFRKGDRVKVLGKLYHYEMKKWGKSFYYLKANHMYNEIVDFGF